MRFPANVLSGIDDTMGSTFFDLNALQVCSTACETSVGTMQKVNCTGIDRGWGSGHKSRLGARLKTIMQ